MFLGICAFVLCLFFRAKIYLHLTWSQHKESEYTHNHLIASMIGSPVQALVRGNLQILKTVGAISLIACR